MKKVIIFCVSLLLFSCNEKQNLKLIKKVTFNIENDAFREGYSDSNEPFLYYATTNGNLYKYYLNSSKKDSIDLKEQIGIQKMTNYSIIFNKENYVVYLSQYFHVYNSASDRLYKLDSLSNYNGMEYAIVDNNEKSLKEDKLILTNLFTCDLYNKPTSDIKETIIACEQLNKKKPSYSILDFKNNTLQSSSITFKDIKPETKNNSSEPWFKASAIYINNDILYNNHFTDGIFKIDSLENFEKVITIKSKYTKFQNTEIFKKDDITSVLKENINYSTQVNEILYDNYRNKIVVILVHGTQDIVKYGELKMSNRPFSVLVYDADYNFEKEYLFDSLKHDFNNIYVCKEGLIINANNKLGNNYEPQKLIYEIFTY